MSCFLSGVWSTSEDEPRDLQSPAAVRLDRRTPALDTEVLVHAWGAVSSPHRHEVGRIENLLEHLFPSGPRHRIRAFRYQQHIQATFLIRSAGDTERFAGLFLDITLSLLSAP